MRGFGRATVRVAGTDGADSPRTAPFTLPLRG